MSQNNNRNSKKQPPNLGDLCTIVDSMFGLKKDDQRYIDRHKKAVSLVEFLNKENGEGYCNLRLAKNINAEYHVRQKIKLHGEKSGK